MTPTQINRQISRFGTVLVAWNNIAALREAAQQLPVRWTFEPGTPTTVVDYLAGGAQGVVVGATIGLGVELLLAALFPAVTFGYALAGGAVLGAIHGVVRVEQGWRVRLVFGCDQQPLLEVRRVS